MPSPKISIILLNWNGKNDTVECLHSIRKIIYPNYETIVVDNGSHDGSQEVIRSIFPEVILIENSSNLGFACGMNGGMKEALINGTEYVFLLNNDTVVDSEIMTELVRACESEKEIVAAVPKIYEYFRRDYLWACGMDIDFGPQLCRCIGFGEHDNGQYSKQQEVEAFTGCGVLIKSSALNHVGLFDPIFFFGLEDVDLSLRFRRSSYKIMLVPEARMWHKISATAGFKPSVFKSKHVQEAVIRCMKKNAGLKEWTVFIFKNALYFPVGLLRQTLKGNFRAFWTKITTGLSTFFRDNP